MGDVRHLVSKDLYSVANLNAIYIRTFLFTKFYIYKIIKNLRAQQIFSSSHKTICIEEIILFLARVGD